MQFLLWDWNLPRISSQEIPWGSDTPLPEGVNSPSLGSCGGWKMIPYIELKSGGKKSCWSCIIYDAICCFGGRKKTIFSKMGCNACLVWSGLIGVEEMCGSWGALTRKRCWQLLLIERRIQRTAAGGAWLDSGGSSWFSRKTSVLSEDSSVCPLLVSDEIHETSRKADQTESRRTSRTAESGLLLFMGLAKAICSIRGVPNGPMLEKSKSAELAANKLLVLHTVGSVLLLLNHLTSLIFIYFLIWDHFFIFCF